MPQRTISGSGANVSHRWGLALAQLPKEKPRAGRQSAQAERICAAGFLLLCVLLRAAVLWGGDMVDGEFIAGPMSHGYHMGWVIPSLDAQFPRVRAVEVGVGDDAL